MFNAPMRRFHLELIHYFIYFSKVVSSRFVCSFPVGLSAVNTTFSSGIVGVDEETVTPTRRAENVALTTKGLLERNRQMLDGTTVEK